MIKIIVTGASGFVGKYLVPTIKETYRLETLSLRNIDFSSIDFRDVTTVVHLAGLAHQMQEIDPIRYYDINRDLTINFAKTAKENGVKHIIFISSVKVYGNNLSIIADEDTECFPDDDYGKSKLEGENGLLEMQDNNFTVSIVRPPLIYGENVKGNIKSLIKLINKLPFVPLGNINNKRSMVYVGNLTALIENLINNPISGIFIAGDKEHHSTTDLVEMIVKNASSKKVIISTPKFIRMILKKIRPNIYQRLFGDFIINNAKTNSKLNFIPPYTFEDGIQQMLNR